MFFCGVCCLFKSSAREKAFTGVHPSWVDEDDPRRERKDYKKYIKRETYFNLTKENYMAFTEALLNLTAESAQNQCPSRSKKSD